MGVLAQAVNASATAAQAIMPLGNPDNPKSMSVSLHLALF